MGRNYRGQSRANWYTRVLVLEQTHKRGRVVSCGQIGYCFATATRIISRSVGRRQHDLPQGFITLVSSERRSTVCWWGRGSIRDPAKLR